jgi:hypothetical protein
VNDPGALEWLESRPGENWSQNFHRRLAMPWASLKEENGPFMRAFRYRPYPQSEFVEMGGGVYIACEEFIPAHLVAGL